MVFFDYWYHSSFNRQFRSKSGRLHDKLFDSQQPQSISWVPPRHPSLRWDARFFSGVSLYRRSKASIWTKLNNQVTRKTMNDIPKKTQNLVVNAKKTWFRGYAWYAGYAWWKKRMRQGRTPLCGDFFLSCRSCTSYPSCYRQLKVNNLH